MPHKEELHKTDSKSAKKAKTDKPAPASTSAASVAQPPAVPPAAAVASSTVSPAASSSAPPSAKDETRKRTRVSRNTIGDVAREAVAALDALLSEASVRVNFCLFGMLISL